MATADKSSQKITLCAAVLSATALLLSCIGIGTRDWYITYSDSPKNSIISNTSNYFYSCALGTNCVYNTQINTQSSTTYRNAAGLSVLGILFLAFGAIMTLVMAFRQPVANILTPVLYFLAILFMLAALAQGSRVMLYNGYSANLYETAHLLTMVAFGLSAFAGGRLSYYIVNMSDNIDHIKNMSNTKT